LNTDQWSGFLAAIPFIPNAIAFGAIVGVASNIAGLTLSELLFSAFTVNAATSQLASLEFWSGTLSFGSVVVATILLNAKHMLHSADLWIDVKSAKKPKLFLIGFAITDSSWLCCKLAAQQGNLSASFAITNAWTLLAVWVLSCSAGFSLGEIIEPKYLIMFGASSLAAISMAALAPKALKSSIQPLIPGLVAAFVALLAMMFSASAGVSVMIATLVGAVFAATRHGN
jgi:predicted branched-subunit amino acid permease